MVNGQFGKKMLRTLGDGNVSLPYIKKD